MNGSRPRSHARARRLGALALLLAAVSARAEILPRRDIQRFGLDAGAHEALVVATGATATPGQARIFVATEYQVDPYVRLASGGIRGGGLLTGGDPVASTDRLLVHIGFSTAFTPRLEMSLRLPFVVFERGGDPNRWGAVHPEPTGFDVPIALRARYRLVTQSAADPVTVAASIEVLPLALNLLPGGDVNYQSSEERGISPRVELGHRFAGWVAGAQVAATFRRPIDYGGERLGSDLSLGAVLATAGAPLRWEVSALTTFSFSGMDPGAELLGGLRYGLGPYELFGFAGPGFGGSPGIPLFRCLVGLSWKAGTPSAATSPAGAVNL